MISRRYLILLIILTALFLIETWAWNQFRQLEPGTSGNRDLALIVHVTISLASAIAGSLWLRKVRVSTRVTLSVWFFILAVILPVAGVPVVAMLAWILASPAGDGLRPEDRYTFGNPAALAARRESRKPQAELRTLAEAMRSFSALELENMIHGLRHLQPQRLALHFLRRFQIDRKSNLQFAAQGAISSHLETLEAQLKAVSSRLEKDPQNSEAHLAAAEILLDLAAWTQEGDATALVFREDALSHLAKVPAENLRASRLTVLSQIGLKNVGDTCTSLTRLQSLTGESESFLKMQAAFLAGEYALLPQLAADASPAPADYYESIGFWSGQLSPPSALRPKSA